MLYAGGAYSEEEEGFYQAGPAKWRQSRQDLLRLLTFCLS